MNCFAAPSQLLLDRHIQLVHSQDPSFSIRCRVQSCDHSFSNFRTFQNHMLKHKDRVSGSDKSIGGCVEGLGVDNNEASSTIDLASTGVGEATFKEYSAASLTSYCAKWILKTSETRYLTRTATVGIVQDSAELISEVISNIQQQVIGVLQEINVNNDQLVTRISDVFKDNEFLKPFHSLMTFQQQLKYYREHFCFVVSSLDKI